MAATLTDSGELTYVSFPISKMETNEDGDLVVYGKASDGAIDHDMQIVDPSFTSAGIQKWLATGGNLRVQHNAQRDPAGIGLEAHTDTDGATWVKSLVVEPVAKKLVSKGALRAYSVGIARPTIVRDAVAKGGRITSGEIVELLQDADVTLVVAELFLLVGCVGGQFGNESIQMLQFRAGFG